MHKFNTSSVFHFYTLRLTTWIWSSPSTEGLKFKSPSKWNSYEGFNLEAWTLHNCMVLDIVQVFTRSQPFYFNSVNSFQKWQNLSSPATNYAHTGKRYQEFVCCSSLCSLNAVIQFTTGMSRDGIPTLTCQLLLDTICTGIASNQRKQLNSEIWAQETCCKNSPRLMSWHVRNAISLSKHNRYTMELEIIVTLFSQTNLLISNQSQKGNIITASTSLIGCRIALMNQHCSTIATTSSWSSKVQHHFDMVCT